MIKNDRWIDWMADQGMIAPFEPKLVNAEQGRELMIGVEKEYGIPRICAPN
ncbi:MAG: hypothetical protein ACRC78_02605 [Planktothrix sp.]